ncbi:MAG: RagB/SusD family nutrient uptake outer membrane protein [Chitinophagaceae bacterium]
MKYTYLIIFTALIGFSSCKKFLDVKPKTQIDGEVAFNDEQGFMDALTGVYLKMNDNELYGKELSFGLTEVLAKQHTRFNSTFHEYYQASLYNYLHAEVRSKIDGIWLNMYGTIANNNNLLTQLNAADKRIFRDNNYNIIKGEALGLRAMLHFDLLRLFAPAPASAGGATQKAIPYPDRLTADVFPQLTVTEVLAKIQADLDSAANLLKAVDPIVATNNITEEGYLRDRRFKFNYYAVRSLQARAYLYAGNTEKALEYAREVINANVFNWASPAQLSAGDRARFSELSFCLYKSDLAPLFTTYFLPAAGATNLLTRSGDSEFLNVFGTSADARYTYLTAFDNVTQLRYSLLIQQNTAGAAVYLNRLPVVRVSEMYYIAAECLSNSDMASAVEYVNIVRRARNLPDDLPATLTPEELQFELFKEYRKEFYCEGQLFYYYKRRNSTTIEGTTVTADNSIYVLPLPDDEVVYGNR